MNTITTFFAGIMVFFSGLFGGSSSIAIVPQVSQSVVVASSTIQEEKQDKSIVDIPELPEYVFEDFSSRSDKNEQQFHFGGLFVPLTIEFGAVEDSYSKVVVRCWKSELLCAYSVSDPKQSSSEEVYIFKVVKWDKETISIITPRYNEPFHIYYDCEKDTCGIGMVSITIDLIKKEVSSVESISGPYGTHATNTYLLVGNSDNRKSTKQNLPKPEISLKPLI